LHLLLAKERMDGALADVEAFKKVIATPIAPTNTYRIVLGDIKKQGYVLYQDEKNAKVIDVCLNNAVAYKIYPQ
jgi:hypothetical protein